MKYIIKSAQGAILSSFPLNSIEECEQYKKRSVKIWQKAVKQGANKNRLTLWKSAIYEKSEGINRCFCDVDVIINSERHRNIQKKLSNTLYTYDSAILTAKTDRIISNESRTKRYSYGS